MTSNHDNDEPSTLVEAIESTPSGIFLEKPASRREFLGDMQSIFISMALLGITSSASLAVAKGPRPNKLKVFSKSQAATYAAWGDELAIGAAQAGVAYFVDKYLADPYSDSLLLLRYLQNPPYDNFYTEGIAGIDLESQARFSLPFLKLQAD